MVMCALGTYTGTEHPKATSLASALTPLYIALKVSLETRVPRLNKALC